MVLAEVVHSQLGGMVQTTPRMAAVGALAFLASAEALAKAARASLVRAYLLAAEEEEAGMEGGLDTTAVVGARRTLRVTPS